MGFEIAVTVTLALGLLFLLLAVRRLAGRRLIAGGFNGLLGLVFVACSLLMGSIALNLHTYHRLSFEQPVAELEFTELGPQRYQVRLDLPGGGDQLFSLTGDEWQLDVRVLKWKGPANLLGLDAQYRLDRIQGRYRSAEQERNGARSVHELTRGQGLDLWSVAQEHGRWLPWVDAVYGSATYLPMANGARYTVTMTQSGLAARPLNPAGEEAVRRWN